MEHLNGVQIVPDCTCGSGECPFVISIRTSDGEDNETVTGSGDDTD